MKKTIVERFRRRFSLLAGVLFLALLAVSGNQHQGSALYEALIIPALLLVAVGTIGRLWCTTYIGGLKNKELVTDGPYSLWRNPLYVFSFIGYAGILVATRQLLLVPIGLVLFLVYYHFVIGSEERRLRELFGAEFEAYCEKVKVVLPAIGNYWSRPVFDMNPKFYRRAMADAGMFWLVLALVELLHRFKVAQTIPQLLVLPF